MKYRKRVSRALFHDSGKPTESLLTEAFINALVVSNISIEIFYSYSKLESPDYLRHFVLLSGIIYAVELFLKIWSCVELNQYQSTRFGRLKYTLHPLVILDFIAMIPILFSGGLINTSFFRIFRIFDLASYLESREASPFNLVKASIVKQIPEIFIIILILISLIVFGAFSFNLVESHYKNTDAMIYDAFPSIQLITSMLTDSEDLNIDSISEYGHLILRMTQVLGLFLIGLPTAFITGAFVAELKNVNELKRLKRVERTIVESFDVVNPIPVRAYLKDNLLEPFARERSIEDLQYRLNIDIEDIKRIATSSKSIRIRKIRDPVSRSERISVEPFLINRSYGVLIHRDSTKLVLSTQSPGEPSLNHLCDSIAASLKYSLLSNQIFSSGEFKKELRQNFSSNKYYLDRGSKASLEIKEFVHDLEELLHPSMDVVYLTAINESHPEDFRVSQLGFLDHEINSVIDSDDSIAYKAWSQADSSILALVARNNVKRILKIGISTRILRTDDDLKYFQNLVGLRDLIASKISSQFGK